MQRVRKFSQTMPDSVLPPPEAMTANANPPRMSTPQNDNSWAGWAISSFTNKLAAASGEIEPNSNGTAASPLDRPASVPAVGAQKPMGSPLAVGRARPAPVFSPSAPIVPKVSSGLQNALAAPDAEDEDYGGDWGDLDDDVADAWGDSEDVPRAVEPVVTGNTAFDDQGEPDFAGWLNAQAQAKTKTKNPLPKGLSKARSPTNPILRTSSMGATATTKAAAAANPARANPAKPVITRPAPNKPAATTAADEDDDWGDAWG